MSLVNQYKPDRYTKLLLHLNNDLHDSSLRGHVTISKGCTFSSSIKRLGTYSLKFDESESNHLTIEDSDDWVLGYGDFTIDFWVYFIDKDTNTTSDFIGQWRTDGSNKAFRFYYEKTVNQLSFEFGTLTASTKKYVTWAPVNSRWYHVAVVRDGDDLKFFVDGEQVGVTQDVTGLYTEDASVRLFIGCHYGNAWSPNGNSILDGYLDEIRLSKGIARWTSDFKYDLLTPNLLLQFDDTLSDSSDFEHVVTPYNSATYSATEKKFGTKALYLDGTDQYLGVADADDWDFGSGDFTVDWWEYRTRSNDKDSSIAREWTNLYTPFLFGYYHSGSPGLYVYISGNGSSWSIASQKLLDSSASYFSWVHYAVVRSGNNFYTFKNGVQQDTWTSALSIATSTSPLSIGRYNSSNYFKGYIDELRVIKGKALWTAGFTPPSIKGVSLAEYSDVLHKPLVTGRDLIEVMPKHWFKLDRETVIDSGHTPLANATVVGKPKLRKLGGVGFNSYYDFPTSSDKLQFTMPEGISNGTLTVWFNVLGSNYSGTSRILHATDGTYPVVLELGDSGSANSYNESITYDYSNNSFTILNVSGHDAWRDGQWHHLAVVSTANGHAFYIDGVDVGIDDYRYGSSSYGDVFFHFTSSATLTLGGNGAIKLRDIQIFTDVLTTLQISKVFKRGFIYRDLPLLDTYPELAAKSKFGTINENRWDDKVLGDVYQSMSDEQTRIITAEDF